MKKSVLVFSLLTLLVACGSGEKKTKEAPTTDTTAKDTSTTTPTTENNNQPQTKDYAYYLNLFKNPKVDGAQLTQNYINDDPKSMEANVNYKVTNAADAGYDEVRFATINPKMYMGEQKEKYENFSKASFDYFQNMDKKEKKVSISEYSSGDISFFYCTRKNNKGSMGSKDYHSMTIQGKSGDLVLSAIIIVYDLKSDMVKPEAGLKKVADFMAQ